MPNLEEYREKIDEIDRTLIEKVDERMRVAEGIAKYKQANNLEIVDPLRERALMEKITEDSASDMAYYNRMLFSLLMEMSADHQRQVTHTESRVVKEIRQALKDTSPIFPEMAVVACQGVQGAYSQDACERFFKMPKIIYTKNFKGVFAAIDEGLCRYGVLPVENSTAGSVNRVYDLMRTYDFHIVKSIKIKIEHSLLVNKGVQKADIKEIISQEQALSQCDDTCGGNSRKRRLRCAKTQRRRRNTCRNPAEGMRRRWVRKSTERITPWKAWNGRCRTAITITLVLSVSRNLWKSIRAQTRPVSCVPRSTRRVPCTKCSPPSMPAESISPSWSPDRFREVISISASISTLKNPYTQSSSSD